MKYLITGGAGFIGSEFTRRAFIDDLNMTVIDKLSYAGDIQRIKGVLGGIGFYRLDITDVKNLEELFMKEKPNIVIHFAAETHVDRSILKPMDFVFTNIIGTVNLLELSQKYDVQLFIHISTDEVYGEILPDINYKFKESDPLLPSSPYSASKASADMFVRTFYRTYGIPVIVIRPSNNYGPWQYPEKLVPLTIAKVMLNEKIPIYGEGKNIRSWLFVEDFAEAVLKIVEKGKVGEIYNVGSQDEFRNIDVVGKIIQKMGGKESLVEFVADRPGHDFGYSLDISRIREHTTWKPKVLLEKGLERTIDWYLKNKEWVVKKINIMNS